MQAGAVQMKFLADMTDLQRKFGQAQDMAEATANRIGGFFSGMGARIAGALSATGLAAFVRNFALAAEEIQRFSTLANTATADFQKMAYGANRFGISQEKLADILKDVQDKVGDFMQTGGGAMADFFENIAPKVGVTADQFRRLGGADALQLYVSSLQKANVSQSEMTFYLEAIASDSTLLLPLLQDNGKAMGELGEQASRLGVILDDETIAAARELNVQLDIVVAQLRGMGATIASEVLPVLVSLGQEVEDVSGHGSTFEKVAGGIATVLETIAVIGVNTNYVLQQTGDTLGGLIAAYQAFFTGNFEGAREIGRQMRENGETARREVDATTARILNARKIADSLKGAEDLDEPRFRRMLAGPQAQNPLSAAPGVAEAVKRTRAALTEREKLEREHSKLLQSFAEAEDDYRQKLFTQRLELQEKGEQEHSDWLKAMEEDAAKYKLDLHDKRLDAQEKAAKDAADELEKLAGAEYEAYADMWKSVDETARDVFVSVADEGMDAFERIGKTLKAAILDMLYQMTVRKWIFQIAGVDVGGMGGMGGMGGTDYLGTGKKVYDYASGAYGQVSTAYTYGTNIGSQQTSMLAAQEAGMGGSGGMSGAAGYAAGVAGGVYGGRFASAGYSAFGGESGNSAVNTGTAIGAMFGPWGALIGGVIGGLVNSFFGTKIASQGIAGNFDGAGGIQTAQFQEVRGGLFRDDKVNYEPIGDDNRFNRQLLNLRSGMEEAASVMGLGAESVKKFAGSINLDLRGLDAEEAMKKTKEEFTRLQAQMLATASFAPELTQSFEQIAEAGMEAGLNAEEAAQYAREVTARDDSLKRQGFEAMTNYYIGLINQTEEVMMRAGITSASLADVITAGMTGRLDESQVGAQLADIVLGGIYNTIAGGFAAQISDVFMQQIIQPIMMSVTAGVPLASAISSQAMATVVATAQNAAAQLTAIFSDPTFRQTMAQLQTVIGGIASVSVKPARSIRAFGSSALAAGDAARRAADEQRRAADEQRRLAEQIKAAWQQIGDSITEEIRRIRGEILGDTSAGQAAAQAQFAIATAQARAGNQDAASSLPELSRAVLEIANATATSLGDLRAMQGATLGSLSETRRILSQQYGLQIPAFAVGTDYVPRDMLAMVHRGEQIVPAAYNPHANGANNDAMVNEMRALREEVKGLRAAADKNADKTSLLQADFHDAVRGRVSLSTREATT